MKPNRPENGSGLPAPYEDPWRRLAVDLRAVAAASWLKLRELWRRNREGDLPRPSFWPVSLAALFWPLLLALLLGLIALGAFGLTRHAPAGSGDPGALAPAGGAELPAGPAGGEGGALSAEASLGAAAEALPPVVPEVPTPAGPVGQAPPAAEEPLAEPAPSAPDQRPATLAPPSPDPQQLLQALIGPEPPAWVLGLEALPSENLLRLRVAAGFSALADRERRSLTEAWLARAQALGYEQLELLDPADQLLARPARVGSGMILLNPSAGGR